MHVEVPPGVQDRLLDGHVVDHVAVRQGQPAVGIVRPRQVWHAVRVAPHDRILLRHPRVAQQVQSVILGVLKRQHERRQVGPARQVQAAPATTPHQIRWDDRLTPARIPPLDRQPRRSTADPDVQPLRHKRGTQARHVPRLRHHRPVVVGPDAHAPIRIRLAGHVLLIPVVYVGEVGSGDETEIAIVRLGARQQGLAVLVLLPTDRGLVESGRRVGEQQRLSTRAGRGVEHVPDAAVLVRVQFVDAHEVRVEAVHCVVVAAQRLELARRRVHADVVLEQPHVLGQGRAGPDDPVGLVVRQLRLVPLRRRSVALGARLAVSDRAVQQQHRRHIRLAVLPGHLDIPHAEPTQPSIHHLPAEQVAIDELLPRLGVERLTRPLAFRMVAQPAEPDVLLRRRRIPIEPGAVQLRGVQVSQVPTHSRLDQLASGHDAGQHVAAIGGDRLLDGEDVSLRYHR